MLSKNSYLNEVGTDCGKNETFAIIEKGSIKSPGFPQYYDHSATCEWVITAPIGFIISLEFQLFSVGSYL